MQKLSSSFFTAMMTLENQNGFWKFGVFKKKDLFFAHACVSYGDHVLYE